MADTDTAGTSSGTGQVPWQQCGLMEKVRRIEQALDERVRPMLAADGGGVDVLDLKGDEVVVQYSGACGHCAASVGGTLYFIEDSLREALGIDLKIIVQGAPPTGGYY